MAFFFRSEFPGIKRALRVFTGFHESDRFWQNFLKALQVARISEKKVYVFQFTGFNTYDDGYELNSMIYYIYYLYMLYMCKNVSVAMERNTCSPEVAVDVAQQDL